MNLTAVFLDNVPDDRRPRFAAALELPKALARLIAAGQEAWPGIRVEPAAFASFLGRCLPAEAADALAELRAGDLYLVCAYGLGTPGAAEALERRAMPRVTATLGRLGTPQATIADIQQELRRRLVEMRSPLPDQQVYAGRGDLGRWLCVCAVREANRRRERGRKERPLEESEAVLLESPEEDPEMAYLRRAYKQELQTAFQEALASLTSRDRNLLRYHFLEGLSIDRIGLLHSVHRATAARWINQAREELCLRTRERLSRRLSLSQAGFHQLLGLIESQLSVNLAAVGT